MSRYASGTEVSSERSQGEIKRTLERYGATAFAHAEKPGAAMIEFQIAGKRIRFMLPLPRRDAPDFTTWKDSYGNVKQRSDSAAADRYEQSIRQKWRALALVVKAKLEAVASEITTLEQEFMAQIVLPNGQTVGQMMLPRIDEAYKTGQVPELGWEG